MSQIFLSVQMHPWTWVSGVTLFTFSIIAMFSITYYSCFYCSWSILMSYLVDVLLLRCTVPSISWGVRACSSAVQALGVRGSEQGQFCLALQQPGTTASDPVPAEAWPEATRHRLQQGMWKNSTHSSWHLISARMLKIWIMSFALTTKSQINF